MTPARIDEVIALSRTDFLARFEARLGSARGKELATALGHVMRIVRFRLKDGPAS